MNYLDELADAIRREVDPASLPTGDTSALFRLYAVLALAKTTAVTAEVVHNAWVAWMSERHPTHEAIKRFHELPPDVQREDQPFLAAIRKVASRLPGTPKGQQPPGQPASSFFDSCAGPAIGSGCGVTSA